MTTLFRDLRFGWRSLRKQPAFLAVAIGTLALCVGANTAIFTLVDAAVLAPLPYLEPDRLVSVQEVDLRSQSFSGLSMPDFHAWGEAKSLQDFTVCEGTAKSFAAAGERPVRLGGLFASGAYFHLFGIAPLLGRTFSEEDNKQGAAPVVVISESLWRSTFQARADTLGTSLLLDGVPHTLIGVMPEQLAYPVGAGRIDFWVPLLSDAMAVENSDAHGNYFLRAMARLQPGVSLAAAKADLGVIQALLAQLYPNNNGYWTPVLTPIPEEVTKKTAQSLWLLLGAVGVVLLIGCVNLANLLQARGATRKKEMALRAALGAPRGRLVQQLLTESVVLGLLGGGAGLFVGWWLLDAFVVLAPKSFARMADVHFSVHTFLFALLLSLVVGVIFGLLPALQTSNVSLQNGLREAGNKSSGTRQKRRLQRTLTIAQMALALVLTFSAALVINAFEHQRHFDPGFEPDGIVSTNLSLPSVLYSAEKRTPFYARLLASAKQMPELGEVALTTPLPFTGSASSSMVQIQGKEDPPEGFEPSRFLISGNYFSVMKIRLLSGRTITEDEEKKDDDKSPTPIVINEAFAKKFWPEDPLRGPLGAHFVGDNREVIVGVVANVAQFALEEKPAPQMYYPYGLWDWPATNIVSRPRLVSEAAGALRRLVQETDPTLAAGEPQLLTTLIAKSLASNRFVLVLLSAFAALALVLSAVGIYGVTSFNVGQRTREIGIRIALGAEASHIKKLLYGETLHVLLIGMGGGAVAALFVSRLLGHAIANVSFHPEWLLAVAVILGAVTWLATYLPMRRAVAIDPQVALRSE